MSTSSKNSLHAIVFVQIESESLDQLIQFCRQDPSVEDVSKLTGKYDAMIEIVTSGMTQIHEFYDKLRKFTGIQSTDTHLVLKQWRNIARTYTNPGDI